MTTKRPNPNTLLRLQATEETPFSAVTETVSAKSRRDSLPEYDVIARVDSSSQRIEDLKAAQCTTANAEKVLRPRGGQSSRASISPACRTHARSSLETSLSRSASPITSVNEASQNGQDALEEDAEDNEDTEGDEDGEGEDLDTGDETDIADIVSVPINCRDASGILIGYRLDVNETELVIGKARGYAYIGIEHQETDEEAMIRAQKKSETSWMTGWLARKNPEKYEVKPKKFVPNGKGKVGGRWVDVDEDDEVRTVVKWRKALYKDGRWFVDLDVEENDGRRIARSSRPPLQYKLEVSQPEPPQSGFLHGGDGFIGAPRCFAGLPRRCQPPLEGTFSVEQEKRFEGKSRRVAEMKKDSSRQENDRVNLPQGTDTDKTESLEYGFDIVRYRYSHWTSALYKRA
ncbi:hypothetical protein SLS60_007905 [Paraconiothyrium brasiliense]|uniref:Uncharacterized protein n=1 Tax=Paraconiothyrium brasiliense TaxID=300254 RepID=A0ABR3R2X1_9PLEO